MNYISIFNFEKAELSKPFKINESDFKNYHNKIKQIGTEGEKRVYNILNHEYKNVKNVQIIWKNEYGESNEPYDILILEDGNDKKYIEVKTSHSNEKSFTLTKNELVFAQEHMNKYKLYLITNLGKGIETKKDIYVYDEIKDKIFKLNWEDMQELIAGILRAMGYKTIVSDKGPDKGKDIIASPDGLGLEEPRIKVEVKHRKGAIGAPDIRSFMGTLRKGYSGLYVSVGGFTNEAKYEAERSDRPITLIDLDMIVDLIIQHYDNFDIEAKELIPLKKLFWPL